MNNRAIVKAKAQRFLQLFGIEVRRSPSGRRYLGKALAEIDQRGGEGAIDQLVFKHFFDGSPAGVFVEVGAARPDFLSISALFRENGWRVVAVEPNPIFCEAHRKQGHEILQYACGETDSDGVDFSIVHSHDGSMVSNESFSSLSIKPSYRALKQDLEIEIIQVNLRRLDSIMAQYAPEIDRVDCCSIDTEGWELEVLKGFDLDKFRPRVLIIENLMNDQTYRDYMKNKGYKLWLTLMPNEIYVREEEKKAIS